MQGQTRGLDETYCSLAGNHDDDASLAVRCFLWLDMHEMLERQPREVVRPRYVDGVGKVPGVEV